MGNFAMDMDAYYGCNIKAWRVCPFPLRPIWFLYLSV